MPKIDSPSKKFHIIVFMSMVEDYLKIWPATITGQKSLLAATEVTETDTFIYKWGPTNIRNACETFSLKPKERMSLHNGKVLKKYIKRSLVEEWVLQNQEYRLHREKVIQDIDEVSKALNKLFLKDKRLIKKAHNIIESDILPFMDGSTALWLSVIMSAKKDFLRLHNNPDRVHKWDSLSIKDLLEEDNSIKRGMDDVWQYITAREFLLNDSYTIDIGDETTQSAKAVNLRQLLAWLVETCNGQSIDSSVIDPSIEHLRSELAHASGDPKLIDLYYIEK